MLNNGRGISFAADTEDEVGAGSVSSELLDDYEEGTWTPGHNGPSNQVAYGTYTKIGNRVWCQFKCQAAADGATSGDWTGLPFTIRNSSSMGIGGGTRVLINDLKPDREGDTAIAINLKRDEGIENVKI